MRVFGHTHLIENRCHFWKVTVIDRFNTFVPKIVKIDGAKHKIRNMYKVDCIFLRRNCKSSKFFTQIMHMWPNIHYGLILYCSHT